MTYRSIVVVLAFLPMACAAPQAAAPPPDLAPPPRPAAAAPRAPDATPCTFSGPYLAVGVADLFADATATTPIARITSRVRVAALTLPADASGRYRIVLDAPVKATVWMDASVRAFELPSRLDLAGEHLWFPPHAAASAVQAPGGHALVTASIGRPHDSMSRISTGSGGLDADIEPGNRFTTSSASRVEACDALHLTGSTPPSADEDGPRSLADAWVSFYSDGSLRESLGSVRYFRNVTVVEERGGASHIHGGTHFFGFDVWVASNDVLPNPRETRSFHPIAAFSRSAGRRRVTKDTRLRLGPNGVEVPLTVGADTELLVVDTRGGYARVVVDGLMPAGDERQFFIEESALAPGDAPAK
jgi:hypothetical protein